MNKGILADIKELLALRAYAGDIRFFNRQKVQATQAGNRMALARGRGMDFEEVRRYQPGDDIRLIHWPLTARLGKTYTKIYREERERAIHLVVDQSLSMQFATKVAFKSVLAARIAALLGWAALSHHEQVGGIVFNHERAEIIKPKRSRQSLLDMFNLLTHPEAITRANGGLGNALRLLSTKIQTGNVVIIISDYFDLNRQVENYLELINRKCEVINLFIYDPLERALPDNGLFTFTDNGQLRLEINNNNKNNKLYAAGFNERLHKLSTLARSNNMQLVELATSDNMLQVLNHGIRKYGY